MEWAKPSEVHLLWGYGPKLCPTSEERHLGLALFTQPLSASVWKAVSSLRQGLQAEGLGPMHPHPYQRPLMASAVICVIMLLLTSAFF
eukprot:1159428-Pelagomonas_calceolata.AAC.3